MSLLLDVDRSDLGSEDESALRFDCPRCGQRQVDALETIDTSKPADWRCGDCSKVFSVLLLECDGCGLETVEVALVRSEHSNPQAISCGRRACSARRYGSDD